MVRDTRERWIGLLSFGFFIILFASFFLIVPDYQTKVIDFFEDIDLREFAANVFLPAPVHHHPEVYQTVMTFCIVFGAFQFFVLTLRLYFRSSTKKVAETTSNIVWWLGAAYMFNALLSETPEWWVPFLGGLIAVGGFSLVTRSLVVLILWRRNL